MSESLSWMFVENVPLLFDRVRLARQIKVETWLDLTQLFKEIKEADSEKKGEEQKINYVV